MIPLFPGRGPDLVVPRQLIGWLVSWFASQHTHIAYLETERGWNVWIVGGMA